MSNLLYLVVLVLDILAIIEIVKSSKDSGKKAVWILIVFFLPVVGVLLYYAVGRK